MKSIITLLFATAIYAQTTWPPGERSGRDTYSESGDIIVQQFWKIPGRDPLDREVWLVSAKDPNKRQLLYRHQRSADVLFSPEEDWLVINDHAGSGYSGTLLYRRKAELDYERVIDLTEGAWKYFNQRNGLAEDPFDHAYCSAVTWISNEPSRILIRLSGHGGQGLNSRGWYCFYDIATRSFTTDVDALNKGNTNLVPK